MVDDDREVVKETLGQFYVDVFRRRRDHEQHLVMRKHALAFKATIVLDARTAPRQLTQIHQHS